MKHNRFYFVIYSSTVDVGRIETNHRHQYPDQHHEHYTKKERMREKIVLLLKKKKKRFF